MATSDTPRADAFAYNRAVLPDAMDFIRMLERENILLRQCVEDLDVMGVCKQYHPQLPVGDTK